MTPPTITGTIERRLLINYRADPDLIGPLLPIGFSPDTVDGHAMVGICLIQLRLRLPRAGHRMSWRSFNGAHRYSVIDPEGNPSVYIPRRDTDSVLVRLIGGRLYPGHHHGARITSDDDGEHISVTLDSDDQSVHVSVAGRAAVDLPHDSVFTSPAAASAFFEREQIGYSATSRGDCLDVLRLQTVEWSAHPLALEHVESSHFDQLSRISAGAVVLDHGLVIRHISHKWTPLPRHVLPRSIRAIDAA